eukprot:3924674-Pyramimonas_sp.AAC.1
MYGCRPGRSAEAMGMGIAMDMESVAYGAGAYVGGISYDLKKVFDLIPMEIALQLLDRRGMHHWILGPLRGMCSGLRRVFQLKGSVGDWFQAHNGIVQGDALSMIALNSIVTCILEASGAHKKATTTDRSYADDISSVTVAPTAEGVREGIRGFHSVVRAYCAAGGGELNMKKCFTFGDVCAQGVL